MRHTFNVHEKADKLGNADGRMSVVQLDVDLVGEAVEVHAHRVTRAVVARLEATDDVLQSGSDEEVLLLQAELLSHEHVVVGVEHASDVLGQVAVHNRLDVVTVVD